jgi:DNA-binding NarL/FixJ family response regulator
MTRTRVLIADDHTIVRQGLIEILRRNDSIEIVGEASDGHAALAQALATRPDVIVLDIGMPRLNGLEAARRIHRALPTARILVLTMHDDDEYVLNMVRAGAAGYLVKDDAASELIAAIAALRDGRKYFGQQAAKAIESIHASNRSLPDDPYGDLTDREREIFQLVVEGCNNAQIAKRLFISPKTVDNHRTHLMSKLGLHSAAELLRYASRRGLLALGAPQENTRASK